MSSPIYSRTQEFVSTEMDGETVLMSIEHGSYFGIGGVGSLIWERLSTDQAEDALIQAVCDEYEVEEQDCRKDVSAFLADLVKHGLAKTQ